MNLRKIGVAFCILLLAGLTSPATAHLQLRNDPAGDLPGGRLDLKRAGVDHTRNRLVMRALTWTSWSNASLEGGEAPRGRALAWAFDSHGGQGVDYGVIVDSRDGKLIAYLARVVPDAPAERVGVVDDVRRDGRFVEASIRKHRMEVGRGFVRWAAQTIWTNGSECKVQCFDTIPEQPGGKERLIRHDL